MWTDGCWWVGEEGVKGWVELGSGGKPGGGLGKIEMYGEGGGGDGLGFGEG